MNEQENTAYPLIVALSRSLTFYGPDTTQQKIGRNVRRLEALLGTPQFTEQLDAEEIETLEHCLTVLWEYPNEFGAGYVVEHLKDVTSWHEFETEVEQALSKFDSMLPPPDVDF